MPKFAKIRPHPNSILAPLRKEVLSREAMLGEAVELSRRYAHVEDRRSGLNLSKRLKDNFRVLEEAYFTFSDAAKNKEVLTAGAEWILDNFHVIEEQVREIKRDLPKSYYRALPKLTDGEWRGYPRSYQLACDFVSHTDASVDIDLLTSFVSAYQQNIDLKIGEIWAIPIMLRFALVENLRRLAETSLRTRTRRQAAESFCHAIFGSQSGSGTELLVKAANQLKESPDILDRSAVYVLRILRSRGTSAALTLQWLDERLREKGIDPNELSRIEQQAQAADQISFGNSITALKNIQSLNWREWFERVSPVDQILSMDPAGAYKASDFITRDNYRHKIEELSRIAKRPEVEIASEVVALAKEAGERQELSWTSERFSHIGYYLVDQGLIDLEDRLNIKPGPATGLKRWLMRRAFILYISSITLFSSAGIVLACNYASRHGASDLLLLILAVVLLLPISDFATTITQWIAAQLVGPKPLPKLDLESGIPEKYRSVVAVQALFSDKDSIERVVESLEIRYLGNDDPNLFFVLLADLPDSLTKNQPGDRGLIYHAVDLIRLLNEKYCSGGLEHFFVLFRDREWNEHEGKFMGFERKRGKVMEFNRLLRGASDTTFSLISTDISELKKARYVITLDSDTQLPPNVGKKLVGVIAHPLNRAKVDELTRTVVEGYGIIQPRVGITLRSSIASSFSQLFCGNTGLDPYTLLVSDVYQDLFKEGSFVGKAIYEIDTFEKVLAHRVPVNSLLSHDLFEGLFARTALAPDIELFDEFPSRYHAYSRRQERWIRGDWQLLPWTRNYIPDESGRTYRSPFTSLERWKIIDNLRRSLVSPALLLSLLMLWTVAPGKGSTWLIGTILVLTFSAYSAVFSSIMGLQWGYSLSSYFGRVFSDILRSIQLAVIQIVLLPHQSFIALRAICTTLYRLYISKRHLLEWETASAAEKRLSGEPSSFFREMAGSLLLVIPSTAITALYLPANDFTRLVFASVVLTGWYISPVIAWLISLPIRSIREDLEAHEKTYLYRLAYDTWQYFERYLRAEYNFLIPDNLQIVPKEVVAERTSPTNISLSTLSVMSAYDLGFIPLTTVLEKLTGTFNSLEKLERFHGHFLNWYEIKGLTALPPRYVSSVDSGNMVGHFVALKEALKKSYHAPIITRRHFEILEKLLKEAGFVGEIVDDTVKPETLFSLDALARAMSNFRSQTDKFAGVALPEHVQRIVDEIGKLDPLLRWSESIAVLEKFSQKKDLPNRFKNIGRILKGRAPSLSFLTKLTNRLLKFEPFVSELELSDDERRSIGLLREQLIEAQKELSQHSQKLTRLIAGAEQIVNEMDFRFLYDEKKKLLVIGYNVDRGQKDNSYYDLFASEARLASLVAIAKGDLPQKHWFALNRTLTDSPGGKALLSWSATMFEYLMPLLVIKDFPGTLLSETYRAVVRAQRYYGRKRGIPWGISESAYSGVDFEKTYQYKAFGIPGLGLKRGLADDLVVSPYSTALSISIDPRESVRNLKRLEALGVRGRFGFYEAVDFTKERLSAEETSHVVRSFLAHHQGMTLVSLTNFLSNDIWHDRFHSDPNIKACELLLQERFPSKIPIIVPHQAELSYIGLDEMEARAERAERLATAHTPFPRVRVLSNGRYSVVIDNAGGGASFLDGQVSLTRWREDGVGNGVGSYVYVKDTANGHIWSNTYQPTCVEPENYEVIFNPEKVEFKRQDGGISIHTEITVSPEDNVEIKRITATNVTNHHREIDLVSYGEVALANWRDDLSHPAYFKMFVESEFLAEFDALIFSRRLKSDSSPRMHMMHSVTMPIVWAPVRFETSRNGFIGRGRTLLHPKALERNDMRKGTLGTVLDPVFSLKARLELEPGASHTVNFITGFAPSKEEVVALVKKYRESHYVTRAFEMAWSQSDIEIRHQQFTLKQMHSYQRLANAILYNIEALRGQGEIIKKNRLSQSALWRFGISGDDPIVLLTVSDPEQVKIVQELLIGHEYLRLRGIRFDLVILNEYPGGYFQDFQLELELLIRSSYSRHVFEKAGGVFLRSAAQLSEEEVTLLQAVSRVVFVGNKGPLSAQLNFDSKQFDYRKEVEVPRQRKIEGKVSHPKYVHPAEQVEFGNSVGGFVDDGKAYMMHVGPDRLPPQPWSNVVANNDFGFLVTESGAGFTWSGNSRENRLSSWSNDPVSDPFSEVLYIRNSNSGDFWCPTPKPVNHGTDVRVKHGFGFSEFSTQVDNIFSKLTVSVATDEKIKWWHLELVNGSTEEKTLELFLYFEWLLGTSRDLSGRFLTTGFDKESQILYAMNPFNIDFSQQVAFIGSSHDIEGYTSSKAEFVGRHRDLANPAALERSNPQFSLGQLLAGARAVPSRLSGKIGAGFESCGVLKVNLTIAPGQSRQTLFYLGQAAGLDAARVTAKKCRSFQNWTEAFKKTRNHWSDILECVQVKTPNRAFDIMANGWLLYQTYCCRMMARTGFYQSSGALGFRDQLQDSLALLMAKPEVTRSQILLHASRQFAEGDVQHWWHPPTGRGVRTRISDNYLWLPYAVHQYVTATGDYLILDEKVNYLEAPVLGPDEIDSYQTPKISEHSGTIFEHCIIALDRAIASIGSHGLPLIGTGDWNDGLNSVGKQGKGESIWLGWFIADILAKFAPLLEERKDNYRAQEYRKQLDQIVSAIETDGWDGEWYRRAYFDSGEPLGSKENAECQIDSIAQSWGVISGLAKKDRQISAMDRMCEQLVDREGGLVLLLKPPFDRSEPNPGYIRGYPPGLRENGGQYTHAAAWVILAIALLGKGGRAMDLFNLINPVNHTLDRGRVAVYQTEPYVMCGDVYSMPPFVGRGGWSWYSGSSGWLYRVAIESILGLTPHGEELRLNPCIPKEWDEFSMEVKYNGHKISIRVKNPLGVEHGLRSMRINGQEVSPGIISLTKLNGASLQVEAEMG